MNSVQSIQRGRSASSTGSISMAQSDHRPLSNLSPSVTVVVDSELTARLSSASSVRAADHPAADPRPMRRIFADDADWTLSTVPDLVELTIRHIVANFASQYRAWTCITSFKQFLNSFSRKYTRWPIHGAIVLKNLRSATVRRTTIYAV